MRARLLAIPLAALVVAAAATSSLTHELRSGAIPRANFRRSARRVIALRERLPR